MQKSSLPRGYVPTDRPALASRYTDYVIPGHIVTCNVLWYEGNEYSGKRNKFNILASVNNQLQWTKFSAIIYNGIE